MKKNILKILLLVVIDQAIKLLIINTIGQSGNEIMLIPSFLKLNFIGNAGAAFGMLENRIFLILLDVIILIFIIKILTSKKYELDKISKFGISLVLAGGIGNLIDRIFRGEVIDYIDVTQKFDFPVFNFADILIVLGIIITMASIIIATIKKQEEAT